MLPLAGVTSRASRLSSGVVGCIPQSRVLHSVEDTQALGARCADLALAGDTILLNGDYGAGKSCFARGFLQRWFGDPNEVVASPSYLIDIVYPDDGRAQCPGVAVHHMDLWRLPEGKVDTLVDLPSVFSDCVSLIEWPDRLGTRSMPREYLSVHLAISNSALDLEELEDSQPRFVTLEPTGDRWLERVDALLEDLPPTGSK